MDITEKHVIKQMNTSLSQTYDSNEYKEGHEEHMSYCKRKRMESNDNGNTKRLKSDEFSKSYSTDPAGYLDQDFTNKEIDKILGRHVELMRYQMRLLKILIKHLRFC